MRNDLSLEVLMTVVESFRYNSWLAKNGLDQGKNQDFIQWVFSTDPLKEADPVIWLKIYFSSFF